MIDEFKLIDYIKNKFHSNFIGDDSAVIPINNSDVLVISSDILIEKVHFFINKNNLSFIGSKALISNISDIVAMGVEPKLFFLNIGFPENISGKIKILIDGIYSIAKKYNIQIAGGDLSKSEKLIISISIIGFSKKENIVYRSGALQGDDIWITGCLGDSEIGLRIIKEELNIPDELKEYFIEKHYIKEIHFEFIPFLAFRHLINSMIDVSDGFLQDLSHILIASKKRALIYDSLMPVSKFYKKIKEYIIEDYKKIPFISGEEYEIIFTSSPENRKDIENIAKNFKVPITRIGKIEEENLNNSIIEMENFKIENFSSLGYKHF